MTAVEKFLFHTNFDEPPAPTTPIEPEEPLAAGNLHEIAIPIEAEEVLRSPQRVMRRLERLI